MMRIPERVNGTWIDSLTDGDLLAAESQLHTDFAKLDGRERKKRGSAYDLMRGPAGLLAAWDRWSRVSTEARARRLHVRRAATL
jgi:hypothetical protein